MPSLDGVGRLAINHSHDARKKPFYAGTYFPKRKKYGHPGLINILTRIEGIWRNNKEQLVKTSKEILEAVKKSLEVTSKETISKDIVHETYNEFSHFFDSFYGGFGTKPKFPTPHNVSFLLKYWKATGQERVLTIAEKTLSSIYKGGIFDHIGF